jgi:hypothetical protein
LLLHVQYAYVPKGDTVPVIPVIVLEYDFEYEDHNEFIYNVAVKGHTIDGWFLSNWFKNVAKKGAYPKSLFGIDDSTRITQAVVNKWGLIRGEDGAYNYGFVSLHSAWKLYAKTNSYDGDFDDVVIRDRVSDVIHVKNN